MHKIILASNSKVRKKILDENNVVNIPIPSVSEKPLIGPEPIKNKIIAANNVVIFASSIAVLDFV